MPSADWASSRSHDDGCVDRCSDHRPQSHRVQLTCSQDYEYDLEGVVAHEDWPSHTPARSDWFKLLHCHFPCFGVGVGGRCGFDSQPRNSELGLVLSHNSQPTPDPTLTTLQLQHPHNIPQSTKVRPRHRRIEADTLDASGKIVQLVASRVDNTSIEKLARATNRPCIYLFSQRFQRHFNIQSTAESYASDSLI
jgi:hypothetical protein